jgi:hypothetical protein
MPSGSYAELLTVVLGLDEQYLGRPGARAIAGVGFRGGHTPVGAGTIRQHHEPKALDELSESLLAFKNPTTERLRSSTPSRDASRRSASCATRDLVSA